MEVLDIFTKHTKELIELEETYKKKKNKIVVYCLENVLRSLGARVKTKWLEEDLEDSSYVEIIFNDDIADISKLLTDVGLSKYYDSERYVLGVNECNIDFVFIREEMCFDNKLAWTVCIEGY